ncbi:hypothetical protein [Bradyrhizobium japonicum]|uniref:hypothetical protein n=1 Tax=Bradyrhizobium japonicum TaxID=375 RepID=UPI000484820F|nr:hypothetical protein [Bradyrhizobium japonicum]
MAHYQGRKPMSGNLTQFGEDLRPHLLRLQASLNNINGLFACCPPTDDAQCAEQLENLRALAIESCARAGKLRETLEAGLARDAVLADETLPRWVLGRQSARLHARADSIELLAAAAMELAKLSAVQAESITMALRVNEAACMIQRMINGCPIAMIEPSVRFYSDRFVFPRPSVSFLKMTATSVSAQRRSRS